MNVPLFTEWTDALGAALAEPFAKELHAQKDKKGTFVQVHHYTRRLNELVGAGGWAMLPPVPYSAGEKFGLAIGISILGVAKWNVGDEMEDHGEPVEYTDKQTGEVKEKVVDFGSSSTNSFAQAFKRCCSLFGLGLYLYDKDFTRQYLAGRAPASNGGDAPTFAQLELIERLQKSHLITDSEKVRLKRSLEKVPTRDQAKLTIDWLTEQIKRRKVGEGATEETEAGVRG